MKGIDSQKQLSGSEESKIIQQPPMKGALYNNRFVNQPPTEVLSPEHQKDKT